MAYEQVGQALCHEYTKNLERWGSCLRLCVLLKEEPNLIHQLGPEGITVLHKGVQHGCVKLVKYILVDMFDSGGNLKCTCSPDIHGKDNPCLTREGLVRRKSEYSSTAVNMAVVSGSPKMVLLLKWAIDKFSPVNWELFVARKQAVLKIRKPDAAESDLDEMVSSWRRERRNSVEGESGHTANYFWLDYLELRFPNVADETIDVIYDINETESDSSNTKSDTRRYLHSLIPEVYSLIGKILDECRRTISDQDTMDMLIDRCQKHPDFEFVPVPHVFLHFLFGISATREFTLRFEIVEKILEACKQRDELQEQGSGSMVVALFNILDPRGRTFLHVALENDTWFLMNDLQEAMERALEGMPPSIMSECWDARDGAGRSILHLACILNSDTRNIDNLVWDLNVDRLLPIRSVELDTLKIWCFPLVEGQGPFGSESTPFHLAVVFNSEVPLHLHLPYPCDSLYNDPWYINRNREVHGICRPLQIAAFFGRSELLEHIMQHHRKSSCTIDRGLENASKLRTPNVQRYELPAIHCAALSGQVEAIRGILKYLIYDPMIQDSIYGTALHLLLRRESFKMDLRRFHILALFHVLPNSEPYKRIESDFFNLLQDESDEIHVSGPFSANAIGCINLLLQSSIDLIWTPHHKTKELPSPGPATNEDARSVWYNKVFNDLVALNISISNATNATSVIAALVATGSVIGPLQPPLGLSSDDGYVDTGRSTVQVYMVCNSLSFFFSIASILMAILPSIPMLKKSLIQDFKKGQRCLKGAAFMLLVSIICILVSFSAASLAVISPRWHDKQAVVSCIVFGGVVCVVVLVMYSIRLLLLLLHH